MLSRGVGRIVLAGRLFAWRVRYRLRRLWIERRAQRVTIRARTNPTGDVTQGYIPPPAVLSRVIDRVVADIQRDPAVTAAAREIEAAQREGRPVSLTSGAHFLASSSPSVLARGGAIPGSRRRGEYTVGGHRVTEQEIVGVPGRAEVAFGGRGGTYPAISEQLGTGGDAAIAAEIRQTVARGGAATRGLHARLAYLMLSRESARSPRNIAFAAFTLQEIERGEGRTFATAFTAHEAGSGRGERGGGGEYPLSRARARVSRYVRLVRERFRRLWGRAVARVVPSRAPTSRAHVPFQRERETARREREQARRWLINEATRDRVMFRNERDVERYVRFKLRQFYGLDPAPGGARVRALTSTAAGSG